MRGKKMKYGLSFINSNHVFSVHLYNIKKCYLARVRKHLSKDASKGGIGLSFFLICMPN